jgi:flagellar protein FlaG
MQEQTVTRVNGSEVTRSGWPGGAGRADAPRPEAARTEAPQAGRPLPDVAKADEPSADAESAPGSKESPRDAAFPTSYARFSINAETQKLSIKIVDAVTDEVIREIPPEQVQRIADDLQSLARRGSIGKKPAGAQGVAGGGVDRYV